MQRRHLTLALGSTWCAPWLAALPGAAHAQDSGEFVILQARYGTERGHVDVTDRLRDLARQDRRLRLTNELSGVDPDPGRTKTLRIFARDRSGQERHFEYRERDWIDGAQFVGWSGGGWGDSNWGGGWHGHHGGEGRDDGEFTILYATYGTGRRDVDVTDRLRDLARRDERVRVTNSLFGIDPDPGKTKVLRIEARDRNGQQRGFEYREDSIIDGRQFVGWSRGRWGSGWGPERPQTGQLVIDSASYGNDDRWIDVTQAVRRQAFDDRLDAEVRNEWFGFDPLPGRRKMLSVTFRWAGGPPATVRVAENNRIRLP